MTPSSLTPQSKPNWQILSTRSGSVRALPPVIASSSSCARGLAAMCRHPVRLWEARSSLNGDRGPLCLLCILTGPPCGDCHCSGECQGSLQPFSTRPGQACLTEAGCYYFDSSLVATETAIWRVGLGGWQLLRERLRASSRGSSEPII